MKTKTQFSHVVCPGCTLLCDDIDITTRDRITTRDGTVLARNACEKGQAFFSRQTPVTSEHFVSGVRAEFDAAIEAAAEILRRAQSPLIFGLDQLTTQSQQTAWKIADCLGANVDTTPSNAGRSSMFALQQRGKVTASLGEIARRSDLIVFWFCDPETTHPRLLERLDHALTSPHRRVIVIDDHASSTSKRADQFIRIKRESATDLLAVIRGIGAGLNLSPEAVLQSTGLEISEIKLLSDQFQSATYGSIFYGQTTADSVFDLASDHLSLLVRDLNNVTRFVGMKLRLDSNAQSGENVLAWSAGYPFATNHSRGYPRYHWLEYSAESVLARQECDAVLFATRSDPESALDGLPESTRDFFDSIPGVIIGRHSNSSNKVVLQTCLDGLDNDGEFCRNDDVSLPLTAILNQDSQAVSAAYALEQILAAIEA